jgi:hypothetical protein
MTKPRHYWQTEDDESAVCLAPEPATQVEPTPLPPPLADEEPYVERRRPLKDVWRPPPHPGALRLAALGALALGVLFVVALIAGGAQESPLPTANLTPAPAATAEAHAALERAKRRQARVRHEQRAVRESRERSQARGASKRRELRQQAVQQAEAPPTTTTQAVPPAPAPETWAPAPSPPPSSGAGEDGGSGGGGQAPPDGDFAFGM